MRGSASSHLRESAKSADQTDFRRALNAGHWPRRCAIPAESSRLVIEFAEANCSRPQRRFAREQIRQAPLHPPRSPPAVSDRFAYLIGRHESRRPAAQRLALLDRFAPARLRACAPSIRPSPSGPIPPLAPRSATICSARLLPFRLLAHSTPHASHQVW